MIKKIAVAVLSAITLAFGALYLSGYGYIVTAFNRVYLQGNITANINDHTTFNVNTIKAAVPQHLPKASNYNSQKLDQDFVDELEAYDTAAFLVVQNGEIIYENYLHGYDDRSKTNSFSMAKTVLTLLLGIAIEEGIIEGLDQPLADFLTEFSDDPLGKNATIGQLADMTSGYAWDEHYYSPLSPTVELLYGSDVEEFLLDRKFTAPPGTFWQYSSASTQLLGVLLKRALSRADKAITLSAYLSEKIWQPLHMNDDAYWHTDQQGMELAYCCISTNARNYAKLGLLMLANGKWQEKSIVPRAFVQQMIRPAGQPYYGLSTWLELENNPAYYHFNGHLGQYIIVVPEYQMVIVRLGERQDQTRDFRTAIMPRYVRQAMSLVD